MWHSTTRQSKQKISANLDHHWSKKCSFLCVQTTGFVHQRLRDFVKNGFDLTLESLIVTRVESFCEKRDSNRVTIFLNVTRVEPESPKIVTRVIEWSHAITGEKKRKPLELACSKLDLLVKNASCYDGVLSAWFHL